jgi:hypothetical protein
MLSLNLVDFPAQLAQNLRRFENELKRRSLVSIRKRMLETAKAAALARGLTLDPADITRTPNAEDLVDVDLLLEIPYLLKDVTPFYKLVRQLVTIHTYLTRCIFPFGVSQHQSTDDGATHAQTLFPNGLTRLSQ